MLLAKRQQIWIITEIRIFRVNIEIKQRMKECYSCGRFANTKIIVERMRGSGMRDSKKSHLAALESFSKREQRRPSSHGEFSARIRSRTASLRAALSLPPHPTRVEARARVPTQW